MCIRDSGWPDLSDEGLSLEPELWLAPHLLGRASLAAIQPSDLDSALAGLLPWEMKRRLDQEAPTHFTAPNPPIIHTKLGLRDAP